MPISSFLSVNSISHFFASSSCPPSSLPPLPSSKCLPSTFSTALAHRQTAFAKKVSKFHPIRLHLTRRHHLPRLLTRRTSSLPAATTSSPTRSRNSTTATPLTSQTLWRPSWAQTRPMISIAGSTTIPQPLLVSSSSSSSQNTRPTLNPTNTRNQRAPTSLIYPHSHPT